MRAFFLLILFALLPVAAYAATPQDTVQTSWRLLDYLAVDYSGAVKDGRIISSSEYAEMQEFSTTVEAQLNSLPTKSEKPTLVATARKLQQAIENKAGAEQVAAIARGLGAALLKAYPVPLAPQSPPDVARGTALYSSQCAACHGVSGNGQGPNAAKLNPPPINFQDRDRADQRSLFALQQVITQGLDGTAMQSFEDLPEQDRWALAFRVAAFAYSPALVAQGERIWKSDPKVRAAVPDLTTLVGLTPQALASQIGADKAAAVMAYLRTSPQALHQDKAGSLALTRSRLAESVAAYRGGDSDAAKRLALSAYLDGFEPVEPLLSSRNPELMQEVEAGMGQFRSLIANHADLPAIDQQAQALDVLFGRAEEALAAPSEGGISTFLSALTILLREGVEALLIVVAMIAFLRKSDRAEALPWVHAGWTSALFAGALTWLAATSLISISGASRELTEGFGGVFAAVVLVSVGIWMHGKSQADAWQTYIRARMSLALGKGSAWFLFGLAFIVVYREVFETILFYAAMWTEGAQASVLGGAAAGAAVLAVLAWVMVRFSVRLPIVEFFRYSSILIAVLAVVLAGKGVAALQEAGFVGLTPLRGVPQIDAVGLHPTVQVVLSQLGILGIIVVGFALNARSTTHSRSEG